MVFGRDPTTVTVVFTPGGVKRDRRMDSIVREMGRVRGHDVRPRDCDDGGKTNRHPQEAEGVRMDEVSQVDHRTSH